MSPCHSRQKFCFDRSIYSKTFFTCLFSHPLCRLLLYLTNPQNDESLIARQPTNQPTKRHKGEPLATLHTLKQMPHVSRFRLPVLFDIIEPLYGRGSRLHTEISCSSQLGWELPTCTAINTEKRGYFLRFSK